MVLVKVIFMVEIVTLEKRLRTQLGGVGMSEQQLKEFNIHLKFYAL